MRWPAGRSRSAGTEGRGKGPARSCWSGLRVLAHRLIYSVKVSEVLACVITALRKKSCLNKEL